MKTFYIIILTFIFLIPSFSQSIKKITTFTFDHNSRDQVFLTGDFNNWNPRSHPMYRKDGKWHLSLELKQGYHYYCFLTKTNIMPDPKYPLIIDKKSNKFISEIKVGSLENPIRFNPKIEYPENFLPEIVFTANPSVKVVFEKSQKLLYNYFYSVFTKNEIYQNQNSPLLALSAAYFPDVIPVAKYLDQFYEPEYEIYTTNKNAVNCAFLPYCEFRYFQITGDDSRFKSILPKLLRKYELLLMYIQNENKRAEISFNPYNLNQVIYSPVFLRSIQALYTRYVAQIAGIVNDEKTAQLFVSKYVTVSDYIMKKYFHNSENSYYDKWEDGKKSEKFHSGILTTVLAEVCPNYSLKSVKNTFSQADYFYPIYNYLYCKGLSSYQNNLESYNLAEKTILKIIDVFNNCLPIEEHLNKNEKYTDAYVTFWNSYSSRVNSPMLFDNSLLYALQDDVSTAGPGFYNLIIEYFLGIELAGNENIIRWKVKGDQKQGIKNINFRNQKIDLVISKKDQGWFLDVKCSEQFKLHLTIEDNTYEKLIKAGYNSILIN